MPDDLVTRDMQNDVLTHDEAREFAHELSKLFGIQAPISDANTKPFGGVTPTPRAQRAIGLASSVASSSSRYAGASWARASVIHQATRAVATGKISSRQAVSKLNVSLQRRGPSVSTAAPGSRGSGFGGSGYSGAPASQLGSRQTAGSATLAAPVAAPSQPAPLNQV